MFFINTSFPGSFPYFITVALTSCSIPSALGLSPFITKCPSLGNSLPNLLKEAFISSIPEK